MSGRLHGTTGGGPSLVEVLRDIYDGLMSVYLQLPGSVQFVSVGLPVWVPHQVYTELPRIAKEAEWQRIGPVGEASKNNSRLLVLVISEGIWAVRGHEAFGPIPNLGFFRYYDDFLLRLDFIRGLCRHRRFKIVLATQPQIHAWDARTSPEHSIFPRPSLALMGPRMQVVNWAIRKVAREQGLLLADVGGASEARRDATFDNRHYDTPDNPRNNSLGVTLTFGQLMLAAALEAVTTSSPASV